MNWNWFKRKKRVKKEEHPSNEKVLVLYFEDHGVVCETWSVEKLWDYMADAYKTGQDPLDLMHIQQNEYALGKAEVFGMHKERSGKYGR